MKKSAGFLKFLETIALVFEIIAIIILVLVIVFLLISGGVSGLAEKVKGAVTISGVDITAKDLETVTPIVLGALVSGVVSLLFAILGTFKTHKVLDECKNERPFSDVSVNNLKAAARLELIGGIVGVICTVALNIAAGGIRLNGASISNSAASIELGFIITAAVKYLLYHVAEYGNLLEGRE